MGRAAKGPEMARPGAANHRGGPASARGAAPGTALAYASGAPQGRLRKNHVSPGFAAREQKVENHVSAVGHDFTSLAWWVVVVLLLIAVLLVLILWQD